MQSWYQEGLRFKCTGCGKCCTGPSGYVFVSLKEAEAIAEHLNIPLEAFIRKYTRRIGNRLALLERKKGNQYDCILLEGKRCTVYEARPAQCRAYPWWPENIRSSERWKEEAERCEGINHPEAPLISLGEIKKHLPD